MNCNKFVISIMVVTACFSLFLLNSCVKFADCVVNSKISIKVQRATTKAEVDTSSIGVYAKSGPWVSNLSNIINNDSSIIAADNYVIFSKGPYYLPKNGDLANVYIFSPYQPETAPTGLGKSPVVTYKLNGSIDPQWGSGSGKLVQNDTSLIVVPLKHTLNQFQFAFKSGRDYPASGNKVTSLIVEGIPTEMQMKVETGECTFSGKTNMQILSADNMTNGVEITTLGSSISEVLLTNFVNLSNYTFDIDIKRADGVKVEYRDVKFSQSTLSSKAYLLTFLIDNRTIQPSLSVVDWKTGTSGSGTMN